MSALLSSIQLDANYLDQLVDICTDSQQLNKYDHSVCASLLDLLHKHINKQNYTDEILSKLAFANLIKKENDEEFLNQITIQIKTTKGPVSLLSQNYTHLAQIIDKQMSSASSKQRCIDLLDKYEFKSQMNNELIESLGLLLESTNSTEIKNACLRLLSKENEKQTTLTSRVGRILNEKQKSKNAKTLIQEFMTSSAPIMNTLRKQLQLKNEQIEEMLRLLNIDDKSKFMNIKTLGELIESILENNPKDKSTFFMNSAFMFLVERCLISTKLVDLELEKKG